MKKGVIGKLLILLAFVVALNPYIMLFTIPVYLIGVILVWLDEKHWKARLLWVIIPVAAWVLIWWVIVPMLY